MTALNARARRNAALTLFVARAIYAFSWYNIGAVVTSIESGLHIGVATFGLVLGAFLVGAAVFQIPAGFAAMRWGSRTVSVAALAIMGSFALASAFSPDWYVLAALRFGVGAGAAFFFAPGLGLVASYFPSGSRGPVIGLYNAGFSVGAATGLIVGAALGVAFGWPWALGVGGLGLLVAALAAAVVLPRTTVPTLGRSLSQLWNAARPVLRSRPLWALSLALTGLWAAFYIVAQYFVAFASSAHPSWPVELAVSLPTVMIVLEVVGGPVGGLWGERSRDMRWVLVLAGVPCGIAVLLIPFLPLAVLIPLFVFLGFGAGAVFAVLYLLPSHYPGIQGEGFALALALLNCVQIFAGSALAIAFGFIAADVGYTDAWLFAGGIGVATLILLAGARGSPVLSEQPIDPVAPRRID
ncbi:MAG: MFS transporter [Thermoplasmata archaeon]